MANHSSRVSSPRSPLRLAEEIARTSSVAASSEASHRNKQCSCEVSEASHRNKRNTFLSKDAK